MPSASASPAGAVAARSWVSVSTPHVEVITDAGRTVAERVARRLENEREVLSLAAPALVVDVAPVQVIVFRDAALFNEYAPRWRGLRDEVAGYFQPGPDRRRLLFVDDPGRTPGVAQHEFTHALFDAAMPELPLWLNEGLAEYFSTFEAEGMLAQAGRPLSAHLDWLAGHTLLPLPELFAIAQNSAVYHEGDRRGTFYAQSWALTHMILSGTGDDLGRLERCLVAVREGEPFANEFRREFGDELALRDQLHDYVARPRYAVREWRLSRPLDGVPLRVRDRLPPAEVLASLGNSLLAREQPERELAEDHLHEALARDPGNPDACAGMGWLLLQRGRREEARTWFERVLERDPISVPAVRLLATQLLFDLSSRSDHAMREAGATFVRRALARASAVAPGEPELEALSARSWVVGYGDDPAPGYARAQHAVELLPGRNDVRLDLLALAALTGRGEEARMLYERYFRAATRPELRQAARRALLAGEVRAVNQHLAPGDAESAEELMRAARDRVADDPQLAGEADGYLGQMAAARQVQGDTRRENGAIGDFNAGVRAANQQRYADAAAAFRRAAAASRRTPFRTRALRMVVRMDLRARGERALDLARQGHVAQALAIFASMDRASMNNEDRRWLDHSLSILRKSQAR